MLDGSYLLKHNKGKTKKKQRKLIPGKHLGTNCTKALQCAVSPRVGSIHSSVSDLSVVEAGDQLLREQQMGHVGKIFAFLRIPTQSDRVETAALAIVPTLTG